MRPFRPGSDRPRPAPTPELVEDRQWLQAARSGVGPGGFLRFSDIPAHKLGRTLRGKLYALANSLPEGERANLAQRIKAAATTVTASLAAAFGEALFRATVQRTLESRGALFGLHDHLEQLADLNLLDAARFEELRAELDQVVAALNEFLGQLAREREAAGKA